MLGRHRVSSLLRRSARLKVWWTHSLLLDLRLRGSSETVSNCMLFNITVSNITVVNISLDKVNQWLKARAMIHGEQWQVTMHFSQETWVTEDQFYPRITTGTLCNWDNWFLQLSTVISQQLVNNGVWFILQSTAISLQLVHNWAWWKQTSEW